MALEVTAFKNAEQKKGGYRVTCCKELLPMRCIWRSELVAAAWEWEHITF